MVGYVFFSSHLRGRLSQKAFSWKVTSQTHSVYKDFRKQCASKIHLINTIAIYLWDVCYFRLHCIKYKCLHAMSLQ